MKVIEEMHGAAERLGADTAVIEIAIRVAKDEIGALPVGENRRLIRMITDRDLALPPVGGRRNPVRTATTPAVVHGPSEEGVEDAVHPMDQRRIRGLPLIEEGDRLVGMLALGDVAHASIRSLAGEPAHAVADHHA